MPEFTSEALSTLLTVIIFGLVLSAIFIFIPQFIDIMINVIESSVV